MRRILLFLCISIISLFSIKAQQQELRTLILQHVSINTKLNTYFDGGYYKGLGDATHTRWGIRNSTRYRINSTFMVDAGFMYNRVSHPGVGIENEFRPHQSLRIAYPRLSNLTINHRIRLEERFFTYSYQNKNKSTSRLRYAISTKRAFKQNTSIQPKTLYWKASSELSFNVIGNISDDFTLFQRGRHGLGLGYQLNAKTSLEGTVYYQRTFSNTNYSDHSDITIFNFYIKNSLFLNSK